MFKVCVYGGQYGSEGKGSMSEWLAKLSNAKEHLLLVAGENSPNSGHTCTAGSVRNLPAASFWADVVLLGPDSVISPKLLAEDLNVIRKATGTQPRVVIHENAAFMMEDDPQEEAKTGVIDRISSTGSGSGLARYRKFFLRDRLAVVGNYKSLFTIPCSFLNTDEYLNFALDHWVTHDWIFECSQGVLLDASFGSYPFVTSRTTLPRAAVERNGLGSRRWLFYGVHRTFPIRTGGPSGPCAGREMDWSEIGLQPEIATVTKRKRRLFEFDGREFARVMRLCLPDGVVFTHLDYLKLNPKISESVPKFLLEHKARGWTSGVDLFQSDRCGEFHHFLSGGEPVADSYERIDQDTRQ